MSDLLTMIDERLVEIRDERERLEAALRVLVQGWQTPTPAPTRVRVPASARVRTGSRLDQFVQVVRDNPGIKTAQVVEKMPNRTKSLDTQIYSVRKHAVHRGLVTMNAKTGELTVSEP